METRPQFCDGDCSAVDSLKSMSLRRSLIREQGERQTYLLPIASLKECESLRREREKPTIKDSSFKADAQGPEHGLMLRRLSHRQGRIGTDLKKQKGMF